MIVRNSCFIKRGPAFGLYFADNSVFQERIKVVVNCLQRRCHNFAFDEIEDLLRFRMRIRL